jgi:arylsulfatase A-like enzyme
MPDKTADVTVPIHEAPAGSLQLLTRFTMAGSFIGIGVGLWEAGMIYFSPSVRTLVRADASYIIWFVAVLVDLGLFALLGAALGAFAAVAKVRNAEHVAILDALLAAVIGAYVACVRHFIHYHAGDPYVLNNPKFLIFPIVRFAAGFFLIVIAGHVARPRFSGQFNPASYMTPRRRAAVLAGVVAILFAGIFFHQARPWAFSRNIPASPAVSDTRPNIVLISLDSARADHLSAYGYARPTTPNIDRLASQGVLFENAIAPSSWTLPGLASILTGMLPHQHGGDTYRVVSPAVTTVAEALTDRGYETVGFNANPFYGLAGWGLGQGFRPYGDDAASLNYNLSRTLVGRLALQPAFQNLRHYEPFFRRSAADVNQDIFKWFRHRTGQPYFIFINYFDVHAPYVAPRPYDRRFGRFSNKLAKLNLWLLTHQYDSVTPQQQASLIAGYDNSFAYVDEQIGRLVKRLSSSPGWANTIVIITADHGEAFGEHGAYGHGRDLHREEIHVPLIIFGRGIRVGKRIVPAVATRSLFATVLDLALGKGFPLPDYSLTRFWKPAAQESPDGEGVVSELDEKVETPLSLTTSQWHYIHPAKAVEELYNWKDDPEEKHNLSTLPQYQDTLKTLHAQLEDSIVNSMPPWLGMEYLNALDSLDHALLNEPDLPRGPTSTLLTGPRRIGATQILFSETPLTVRRGPSSQQDELLKSLPYQ